MGISINGFYPFFVSFKANRRELRSFAKTGFNIADTNLLANVIHFEWFTSLNQSDK